jgi:phosphosulfolactate phosphohydrolase-like enzyme
MGLTLDRCATLGADQVVDFLRSTADIVLILSFGHKRHAPVAVLAVEGV